MDSVPLACEDGCVDDKQDSDHQYYVGEGQNLTSVLYLVTQIRRAHFDGGCSYIYLAQYL